MLEEVGREPRAVKRSMMAGLLFGRTQIKLDEKLSDRNHTAEDLRKRGLVVGVGKEVYEQLKLLEDAGVKCIMLQWLDMDDLKGLEALAKSLL
jgi:hypothetical protein